jgi:Ribonuclease HI
MPVIRCDPDQARNQLEAAGAAIESGNTPHERWRAEHAGATAVAYEDKIVVQGETTDRMEGLLRAATGRVHLYVDGAARGNPGPAAIGWVLVTDDGVLTEGGRRIGETTNNRAEYEALLAGLAVAADYGFEAVRARSDSELVVRQATGEWSVKQPELRERRVQVREQLAEFEEWSLSHVPREVNERADQLANEALDE